MISQWLSQAQQLLSEPGPTAKTALLLALEQMINRALVYDPGTRAGLTRLSGQSLLINLKQPDWQVAVTVADDKIGLQGHCEQPTTEITGSADALLAWVVSGETSLADFDIEVRGSTHLLIEWQALARDLDIDWQDALSRLTGDLAGHTIAETLRQVSGWANLRRQNMGDQLAEFVIEEGQVVPNRALFDDFRQHNQDLRLTVDRLQARLNQVREQLLQRNAG